MRQEPVGERGLRQWSVFYDETAGGVCDGSKDAARDNGRE